MATSNVPGHIRKSFPAGSASLGQFQFVSVNSSGQLITPTVTGAFAVVLDDAPSNVNATYSNGLYTGGYTVGTYYGCVLPSGCVQKVIYNATLNPGVPVMTDTTGKAVAAITGAVILGWTLEAGVVGDLHGILLNAAAHY